MGLGRGLEFRARLGVWGLGLRVQQMGEHPCVPQQRSGLHRENMPRNGKSNGKEHET